MGVVFMPPLKDALRSHDKEAAAFWSLWSVALVFSLLPLLPRWIVFIYRYCNTCLIIYQPLTAPLPVPASLRSTLTGPTARIGRTSPADRAPGGRDTVSTSATPGATPAGTPILYIESGNPPVSTTRASTLMGY